VRLRLDGANPERVSRRHGLQAELIDFLLMYVKFIWSASQPPLMNRQTTPCTEGPLGAVRRLVDAETGEAVPYAPYAFSGRHTQVDKARVEAITESKAFTPSQKFLVLWWIGVSPEGMEPLRATGADIAKRVGMSTDAVGKINRKLAKHRILIVRGRIGNYNFYRISPYIAFHGTGLEQREAVKTCNPPDIPGFNENVPARWEAQ
jgi:hypothetical protein